MDKKILLTVALIPAVIAFSYGYLAGEEKLPVQQQVVENINDQPPVQSASDKPHSKEPGRASKAQFLKNNESEIVAQTRNVRAAPPPPMQANKQRDGRYTAPKNHGHEHVHSHEHDNDHSHSDEKNPPPPPTGAN